jgi:hypothetical protein
MLAVVPRELSSFYLEQWPTSSDLNQFQIGYFNPVIVSFGSFDVFEHIPAGLFAPKPHQEVSSEIVPSGLKFTQASFSG